jgi:ABC-2 type transport system permease protein
MDIGFFKHFSINSVNDGPVSSNDNSVTMQFLEYSSLETAVTAVQNRKAAMGIVIDQNFSKSILSGINFKHKIEMNTFLTNSTKLLDAKSSIEIIGDFSNSLFSSAYSHFSSALSRYLDIYTEPNFDTGTIEIQTVHISRIEFTEFDTQIPGYLVFVLILGISGSVAILASEREMKTIERMILSEYDKKSLILGVAISQLVVTILEIIMFLITIYLIGFPRVGNPIIVLVICLFSIIPILGLGFIIVAYIKDPYLAISIPSLLGIPLIFLAGAFIPLPYKPMLGSKQIQIWHINPLYSMSEAFRKIMIFGESFEGILLELIIIICFGVVLFSSGIKLLSKTIYRIE